jgi:hypothetical protein
VRAARPRWHRSKVSDEACTTDPNRSEAYRARPQDLPCYGVELPEKDDLGGAKVSALLLRPVMRPGTP